MDPANRERWQNEVMDEVLRALAHSDELRPYLVYKGARILRRLLPSVRRASLDLDASMADEIVDRYPTVQAQGGFLEAAMWRALTRHFEAQDPVRFEVSKVSVVINPEHGHPRGWTAFDVKLKVRDRQKANARNLPSLKLDVAAPENLLPSSVAPLVVDGSMVKACTLERIAGEKLRGFLQKLPTYLHKVGTPMRAQRAKDLFDLTHIHRVHPLPSRQDFWRTVGAEFRSACEARGVDCAGLETFRERWAETQQTYETEYAVLGSEVPFSEIEQTLARVVGFLEAEGIVPFEYPLPPRRDEAP